MATQVRIGLEPHAAPYLGLLFFGTLIEYNRHRRPMTWALGAGLLGFVATLPFARPEVLWVLLPLVLLTLAYEFPAIPGFGGLRLRQVPYLKIFLIAGVWAATTVVLPVIHAGHQVPVGSTLLLVLERFLFVFAITIPFDLRDRIYDRSQGLKTLPHKLGAANTQRLAVGCMVLSGILGSAHAWANALPGLAAAYVLGAGLTIAILVGRRFRSSPWYHQGWLDGTLILHAVLVVVSR